MYTAQSTLMHLTREQIEVSIGIMMLCVSFFFILFFLVSLIVNEGVKRKKKEAKDILAGLRKSGVIE